MNKRILTLMSLTLLLAAPGCTTAGGPSNGTNPSASPSPTDAPSTEPTSSPSNAPGATPNFDGFKAEYQKQATTPRGAAHMLFEALVAGLEQPDHAESYLTLVLRSDELSVSATSPTGYVLGGTSKFMLQQIQAKPHIVYSYIGATPETDYQNWNPASWQIDVPEHGSTVGQIVVDNSAEKPDAATGRIYVRSAGKDSPTPINMDRNRDGVWKIQNSSLSNLATGVKPGTANQGDF